MESNFQEEEESCASSPQQNSFSPTFKEPLCENVQIKTEQTCNNSCYGLSSKEEPSALSSPPPPSSTSLTALSSTSAISTSSTSSSSSPPSSSSSSSSVLLSSSVSVTSPKCEILRLVKGAGDDLQVCCTIPLPKNSCLGPFCGDIASNEESCDTLLEFTEHSGKTVCVRLLEESASWLKLLSKPVDMPKNCIVFYEAGRIWCKLIVDLISESALVGSFTFLSSKSQSPKIYPTGDKEKASPTTPISNLPAVTGAAAIKKEETDCSKHAISLPGSNTEIPVFSGKSVF
ncbi:uncharacterized protein LOC106881840 [Octopus bimaculoides]|uniref:uncharacterized protein LOC106881840 n=1 Tax=Octopus bimaculoides TaxID=37653 RepID=UPI0022E7BFD1|nr:uncharacterized protein LOC106881840 [Octopus bimaculoides]